MFFCRYSSLCKYSSPLHTEFADSLEVIRLMFFCGLLHIPVTSPDGQTSNMLMCQYGVDTELSTVTMHSHFRQCFTHFRHAGTLQDLSFHITKHFPWDDKNVTTTPTLNLHACAHRQNASSLIFELPQECSTAGRNDGQNEVYNGCGDKEMPLLRLLHTLFSHSPIIAPVMP